MCPIHINFLPLHSSKKHVTLFKMAEEIFSGYDESPQSDTKHQQLLECVLTRNSKLYLGKVYTEDHLKKRSEEEVDNFLIIMKLNSQVRW